MGRVEPTESADGSSRRRFLEALTAGGIAAAGGLAGCNGLTGTPTATPVDRAVFVLSTARSDQYGLLGERERRGLELAVQHLNRGGGLVDTDAFGALDGSGVLGRTIDSVVLGTEDDPEVARSNVRQYAADPATACFTGGISGSVVREHRDVAAETGTPYLVGASLLSDLAGERCSPSVYREQYTSRAVIEALGPTLASEVGESASYYQLYADGPEGRDLRGAINDYFTGTATPDWRPQGNEAIRTGTLEFADTVRGAAGVRPDAVFVDLFGLDAVNALAAIRDHLPNDVVVVVPYLDQDYAAVLEGSLPDLLGTASWDPGLETVPGAAYENAYRSAFGDSGDGSTPVSGTAHVTYAQTLTFAAAAQRAGSFDPAAVRSELVDTEYDVGLGRQRILSCNQQATRPVPVVRTRSEATGSGDAFELVGVETDAAADCRTVPASECDL